MNFPRGKIAIASAVFSLTLPRVAARHPPPATRRSTGRVGCLRLDGPEGCLRHRPDARAGAGRRDDYSAVTGELDRGWIFRPSPPSAAPTTPVFRLDGGKKNGR